jgi:hypothetical protein
VVNQSELWLTAAKDLLATKAKIDKVSGDNIIRQSFRDPHNPENRHSLDNRYSLPNRQADTNRKMPF